MNALMEVPASGGVIAGRTREQLDLIKRTIAEGATDDELALFLHYADRSGLDPLRRQVYCIVRGQGERRRATFQTSIDGYRSIAARTKVYAGNDDYVYDEGISEYAHIVSGRGEHPETATARVWKIVEGERVAFTATARWSEYIPPRGQDLQWQKMPYLMLGKCAESLALRKAFPEELGGMYTDDEMQQAGQDIIEHVPAQVVERPSSAGAPRSQAAPPRPQSPPIPKITDENDPRVHYWATLCGTASTMGLRFPALAVPFTVPQYESAKASVVKAIQGAGGTVPGGDPDLSNAKIIDAEPVEPPDDDDDAQRELAL